MPSRTPLLVTALVAAALLPGCGDDALRTDPAPRPAAATLDDARPVACRTVNLLDGSGLPQPVEGATDCTAWDVAATADGALWSEVPRPRRQEEARFLASADDTYFDLGPGTTGTAVPCGDSVFFVRDPQGDDD